MKRIKIYNHGQCECSDDEVANTHRYMGEGTAIMDMHMIGYKGPYDDIYPMARGHGCLCQCNTKKSIRNRLDEHA